MLYGLLVSLFVIVCFFLVIIILVQQSKGGMGIGAMGGSTQMLFGGSGGQDIFQKITWVLVAIFMLGSLALSLMRSAEYHGTGRYATRPRAVQVPQQLPTMPAPAAQPITPDPAVAIPTTTPQEPAQQG